MNIIYVITSTNMHKGISSFIGRRSLTNKGVVRSPLYSYRQTERKESLSALYILPVKQRERSRYQPFIFFPSNLNPGVLPHLYILPVKHKPRSRNKGYLIKKGVVLAFIVVGIYGLASDLPSSS